jgi:hypothetical protein
MGEEGRALALALALVLALALGYKYLETWPCLDNNPARLRCDILKAPY